MTSVAFLDGGLGQEINKRSTQDQSHPLWSVKVMHEEPDVVVSVHKDFINAGARVITLNNYTASITRLTRHGMVEKFAETHELAIELVNKAIDESDVAREQLNIAGCLPPLAASYVAAEALAYQESYDEFCQVIDAQAHGVDLFLVETISNITEARAAAAALKSRGKAAHVSLTLSDDLSDSLRSGEPLQDAIDALVAEDVAAIMVNCSFPEAVDRAMPIINRCGIRFGGYANGFTSIEGLAPGTTVDNLTARVDLPPAKYAEHALGWLRDGATIVGGCCEISPAHIAHLAEAITANGYSLDKLA